MKLEDVLKEAEVSTGEPKTCDPCQRAYEDGLREGGTAPEVTVIRPVYQNLRAKIDEMRRQRNEGTYKPSETIPRMTGQELPRSNHNFLPMVCCSRTRQPDAHLGATTDDC